MNVKGQDANTTQLCLALAPVAVYGCVRSLGSDEGFANIIIWVSVERCRTSTLNAELRSGLNSIIHIVL